MRLINVETRRLENFLGDPDEPYAILSHKWGKDEEELSFQDMQRLDECGAGRTAKLNGTCAQARQDGIKYIWIDTCCINQNSAVELSEAITSMFRWYKKSKMCYTYLSDVTKGETDQIRNSRWFTRGWTLQELLASPKITFFDSSWRTLGTKSSLSGEIIAATGIPHHILTGLAGLESASIAEKFSWASKRMTKRPEDMAYCLVGIFDVVIPPMYGEGLEPAFERLQEAIMRKTHDDSILAWDLTLLYGKDNPMVLENESLPPVSGGVLATSPCAFDGCKDIIQRTQTNTRIRASETVWGTIPISIRLGSYNFESSDAPNKTSDSQPTLYGYLSCGPTSHPDLVVAIPLVQCNKEASDAHGPPIYLRPRGSKAVLAARPPASVQPETILIRKDRIRDQKISDDRSYWFYIPGPYPWNGTIEEVYPPDCDERETAMIRTPTTMNNGRAVFFTRFSYGPRDVNGVSKHFFILALEFYPASRRGKMEPRAGLYFDNFNAPQTSLSDIARMWESLKTTRTTKIHSLLEPGSIEVHVGVADIAGHHLWAVSFTKHPLPSPLDIPRGWPDISEQMKLREHGIDLLRLMKDGAVLARDSTLIRASRSQLDGELKAFQDQLESLRAEIARLEAVAASVEAQLRITETERERVLDRDHQVDDARNKYDTQVNSIRDGKEVRRVWVSDQLIKHQGPALQSPEWEEAFRRERNGIVAHIMKTLPLLHGGREIGWSSGMTLLMYAAASGDEWLVNEALKWDSDLNAKASNGLTVFDAANLSENRSAILRILRSLKEEKDRKLVDSKETRIKKKTKEKRKKDGGGSDLSDATSLTSVKPDNDRKLPGQRASSGNLNLPNSGPSVQEGPPVSRPERDRYGTGEKSHRQSPGSSPPSSNGLEGFSWTVDGSGQPLPTSRSDDTTTARSNVGKMLAGALLERDHSHSSSSKDSRPSSGFLAAFRSKRT